MLSVKNLVAVIFSVVFLAACSQNGGRDGGLRKADFGTAVGALGGAFAGATMGKGKGRTLTTAIGALGGAYIGNQLGASLDRADMAYYSRASQSTFETRRSGTTSTWVNPDSGNSGTITPTKTFKTANNTYCREFTQTINIGGKSQEGYGTACRQPDGSWKIKQ